MPRRKLPPRLFLRRRGNSAVWTIRDGYQMLSTGMGEERHEQAVEQLKTYCAFRGCSPEFQSRPAAAMPTDGIIYFISCDVPDYPIKIGWTADVDVRLVSMQTAHPYKLVVLATLRGKSLLDETVIQGMYAADRLEGEWFRRSPELLAWIDSINAEQRSAAREHVAMMRDFADLRPASR